MRTKSRVRGSIGSLASAGKFRLWLSISSLTAAKLQRPAVSRHPPPNAAASPPPPLDRSRVPRRLREVAPRLRELRLVAVERVLDRTQPPHPERRPAERA